MCPLFCMVLRKLETGDKVAGTDWHILREVWYHYLGKALVSETTFKRRIPLVSSLQDHANVTLFLLPTHHHVTCQLQILNSPTSHN